MKIQPVADKSQIQQVTSNETALRARAVAAFKQANAPQQAQETPVLNPNQVSAEELSAIRAPSGQSDIEEEVVEQQAVEETPTQEPPAKTEDPALSKRFAQLARQEKQFRAKQQQEAQALKARESAIAAKEAEIAAKDQEYRQGYISKDRLKQDAWSALAEADVNYEQLTNQMLLSQQPMDPRIQGTISKLEAKIAQLEEQNANSSKSYAEQQQAQYQAAVKQIELDTKSLIKNDPSFEMIQATGSVKDVVELITQTYDKDGILLTVEEAAQQVEEYLAEEALKFTKIDKIKKRMQANASNSPAPAKQQTQSSQKQPQQMKTLTNATASTRPLTARERAIAAMEGRLKS